MPINRKVSGSFWDFTIVSVDGTNLRALVDVESLQSCHLRLSEVSVVEHLRSTITNASANLISVTLDHCFAFTEQENELYPSSCLSILPDLCADLQPDHDFLRLHEKV